MRNNNDSNNRFNRILNPTYMSREWQEEYRLWYENWKKECWNKRFREIRKRQQNENR